MLKWADFQTTTKHLIILIPVFFIFMLLNAGIYQPIHNSCDDNYNSNISYFESLQYLESVAFIIGYGHITPVCTAGKAYTFIFAYLTIPLMFYILLLSGKQILKNVLMVEGLLWKTSNLLRRITTVLTFDFTILVVFMLIPAAIVHHIEPCMHYGTSLWYLFATITTIGFGDVLAGGYTECEVDMDEFYHQNNFFWVSKIGFLLVALSFMMADLMLKYETVVEYFYSATEKMFGKKHLIDNEMSADNVEEIDMNGRQSNILSVP